jgi:hypothetical protein
VAESHISVVVLVGERAFKLKKPVRLPFVDLSTGNAGKPFATGKWSSTAGSPPTSTWRSCRSAARTESSWTIWWPCGACPPPGGCPAS